MHSAKDIALKLGVSPATVSRVLNNQPGISSKTRQMVLEAVRESGKVNASRRVDGNMVGLVYTLPQLNCRLQGFDAEISRGLCNALDDNNYDMAILNLKDRLPDETYTQFFHRKGICAAVFRTPHGTRREILEVASEGFPAVICSERVEENPNASYVDCDSRQATQRAVEYLGQLGHRRIGLCVQSHGSQDHQDRFDAYRDGLAAVGIAYDPALVVPVVSNVNGGSSALDQFLAMTPRVTAVVFTTPNSTIGGLKRVMELGLKLPGDLSIVGFDDSDDRHMLYPCYTAICQDASRIGYEAGQAILKLMRDPSTPQRLVQQAVFEVNQTTGPVGTPRS